MHGKENQGKDALQEICEIRDSDDMDMTSPRKEH